MSNIIANKYHFDFEEFDEVSPEAKDFISRLLRQKSERRLSGEKLSGLERGLTSLTSLQPGTASSMTG